MFVLMHAVFVCSEFLEWTEIFSYYIKYTLRLLQIQYLRQVNINAKY